MFAERWASAIGRYRRIVVALWGIALIASVAGMPYLMKTLGAPDYGVPGSQSAQVSKLVHEYFKGNGDEQDVVLFTTEHGKLSDISNRERVARILTAVRRASHVIVVVGPFDPYAHQQISPDGQTAFATVGLAGSTKQLAARAKDVQAVVEDAAGGGVHAWLTGYSPITNDLTTVENADSERAEMMGIPIALIVLLLALGSIVAATLPLLTALGGLTLTFGTITLVSLAMNVDAFIIAIVSMIGMGVGIDYALFVTSRFREELSKQGIVRTSDAADRRLLNDAVVHATGRALATSGRTVAVSGAVVAISICSLFIIDSPVFREMSLGVLAVTACTLLAVWTLLPAVIVILGPRVNSGRLAERLQPAEAQICSDVSQGGWAHTVMRRPVLAGGLVMIVLLIAALPLASLRYGIDLGTSCLASQPSGKAQNALVRSFGPGIVSPVQVTVTGRAGRPVLGDEQANELTRLATVLQRDPRVQTVDQVESEGRVLLNIVPTSAIDSAGATSLVVHIRSDLAASAAGSGLNILVGGATAQFVDVSSETSRKIPYVLLIVIGLTVLLLLLAFRSAILPLKAALMNLLATAASVGITVTIFQWGVGESLLDFKSVGFLQVYIPISVFVILFALSMDYEIFLVRRIREAWDAGQDNATAVASGIEHTARSIAAAATIMVAVFGSFVTADVLELKEFGLALAIAIAIDATLVRLVLVPAFMRIFGGWNWWFFGRGTRASRELVTPHHE